MARLIIVEDNAELASLLGAAAATHGHEVQVVSTGREGLAALQHAPFDLALVNLLLPDLPGTEILDALLGKPTRTVLMGGPLRDPAAAREAREVERARVAAERLSRNLDAIALAQKTNLVIPDAD